MGKEADFLPGTLDLLILKTLALGPTHGWGVSKRIRQLSRDVLTVNQGSLYPALQRLERRGWIGSQPGKVMGKKVKLYQLTEAGERQLADERRSWRGFVDAVDAILAAEGSPA